MLAGAEGDEVTGGTKKEDTGTEGQTQQGEPEVSNLHLPHSTGQDKREGDATHKERIAAQISGDFSHLTEEEQASLKTLLTSYSDVFALDPSELGTTHLVTHSIDVGEHPPIKLPVRRTPFTLRRKVDELLQEMLDQGVVEPSESLWASPIVLIQKKDGGICFCVDYRSHQAG